MSTSIEKLVDLLAKHVKEDEGISGKGLLVLFIIGVVKFKLGIEFTTNTIEIPWLPKVEIKSIENIVYLYWGLVAYTCYRYWIYSKPTFSEVGAKALGCYLDCTKIGKRFVRKYILDKEAKFISSACQNEHTKQWSTRIQSFNEEVPTESFYLEFKEASHPQSASSSVGPDGMPQKCLTDDKLIKLWGCSTCRHDEQYPEIRTIYKIESRLLRLMLLQLTVWLSIRYVCFKPKGFDVFIPLLLNLGLFVDWVFTA